MSFTSNSKYRLRNLSKFDSDSLDWIMAEHYQFSARNTAFLSTAMTTAQRFSNQAIATELQRNLAEESGHARLYKRALAEIGIDVERRIEFAPTSRFFAQIAALIDTDPSQMLGAMYATETAAIFEHEVFRSISKEAIERRGIDWKGSRLANFHDMHLSGVEQSHKDELGIFLKNLPIDNNRLDEGEIDASRVERGGRQAIKAMEQWWDRLLGQLVECPVLA